MYPVSQVFQIDEDAARGDTGFAIRYGLAGVRRFFAWTYPIGLAIAAGGLALERPGLGLGFFLAGGIGGVFSGWTLRRLRGHRSEYRTVMRLKYGASAAFVAFVGAAWGAVLLG